MADCVEAPGGRTASWSALIAAGGAMRLAVVCFGVWLHAADELIVATMIPSVTADIGGHALIAWTVSLYEIGSITAGAASALAGLRLGLRRAMVAAALIYAAGCAVSAAAPTMPLMLAGRLFQGLGGGGLMALSFIAATRLFPGALMPRAMAAISIVWGASSFVGPLIGGGFAEIGYWRGGFWAMGAQAVALAIWIGAGFHMEEKAEERAPGEAAARLPLARLTALSLGVVAIAAAGVEVAPLRSSLLVLAGLLCLAVFFRLDARRGADRLLPPRPLDIRGGAGAALVMVFCLCVATVAIAVYGPVMMTRLYGVSAFVAGGVLALASIGWTVGAVAVAGAAERHDARLVMLGVGLVAASTLGFLAAVPFGSVGWIALCAAFEGAGFGIAWTFILRRASALTEPAERDRLASALPTTQRFGYAAGAAYVGVVANAAGFAEEGGAAAAREAAVWIFAGGLPFAALGLAVALAFISARRVP